VKHVVKFLIMCGVVCGSIFNFLKGVLHFLFLVFSFFGSYLDWMNFYGNG